MDTKIFLKSCDDSRRVEIDKEAAFAILLGMASLKSFLKTQAESVYVVACCLQLQLILLLLKS